MKRHFSRYSVATVAGIAALWFGPMSAGPHAAQAPGADAAPTASAQTPRTAEGKPDLTGLWTGNPAGRGKVGEQGDFVTGIPARGGGLIGSTGITAGNFERDSTLTRRSDPNKPMYKPQDRSLEPTFMGDSVAHWEGDTLVVDVIGFNDVSWLDTPGYFHSFDMRVTERLRREGNVLHYQAAVEDPVVLTEPWVRNPRALNLNTLPWEDPASGFWEDVPCNETDLEHLVTKEHH